MGLFIGKKFKIISNGIVSHAVIIDIEDKGYPAYPYMEEQNTWKRKK